jgi:hypothetical protein
MVQISIVFASWTGIVHQQIQGIPPRPSFINRIHLEADSLFLVLLLSLLDVVVADILPLAL